MTTTNTTTSVPVPETFDVTLLQQMTNPQVGDLTVANVRSRWRLARIVSIGRVNAKVVCTTPTAYAEALESGNSVRSVERQLEFAAADDATAEQFERLAPLVEKYLADGTFQQSLIESCDWIAFDSLPAEWRAVDSPVSNSGRKTLICSADQYRKYAAHRRNEAEKRRTEGVAACHRWNALSREEKIEASLTVTTKTVKLAELKTTDGLVFQKAVELANAS